jgi:hypothetical protein
MTTRHIIHPVLVGSLLVGCVVDDPDDDMLATVEEAIDNPTQPPPPTVAIDVNLENGQHTLIGPHRSLSYDGRIGLSHTNNQTTFRTITPESLTHPINQAPKQPYPLGLMNTINPFPGFTYAHAFICDPHVKDPAAQAATHNPRACGPGNTHDCYDFTVVAPVVCSPGKCRELRSAPIRIEVANPKTANAEIVSVTITGPVDVGKRFSSLLLEPTVSGDGHLIVTHDNKGNGMQYLVHPPGAQACDVDAWAPPVAGGAPKSLTRAFSDPHMAGYGIAQYPLRNSLNEVIPSTDEVHGAYPWLSRDGNTLFFTQVGAGPFYVDAATGAVVARYPYPFPLPTVAQLLATTDARSRVGVSWVGLWSHGKIVTVDNRINNADFGQPSAAEGGTHAFQLYNGLGPTTVTMTRKVQIVSAENQHNYVNNIVPVLPRDVVWRMVTDAGEDDVAFDDQLDPRAMIISTMQAAVSNEHAGFFDGNLRSADPFFEGSTPVSNQRLIENTATSVSPSVRSAAVAAGVGPKVPAGHVQWTVPAAGQLLGGARIEPIAAGGKRGKGVYLDSDDRIEYTIPAHTSFAGPWMYSFWFDLRIGTQPPGRVLTTPDGSFLQVVDETTFQYKGPSTPLVTITVPAILKLELNEWRHFALISRGDAANTVELYIDGFLFHRATNGAPVLRMTAGKLTLGAVPSAGKPGLVGYYDELKVTARAPGVEEMCNHAYGTLIGDFWGSDDIAAAYPQAFHDEISALLGAGGGFERYRCEIASAPSWMGFNCVGKTHFVGNPLVTCMHRELAFPEGPLHANEARPSTIGNKFCESCHMSSNPTQSLKPAALTEGIVDMKDDLRRQPMQPPRRLWGKHPTFPTDAFLDLYIYP